MFRDMIFKCSEAWHKSKDCPVKELISYIYTKGAMRDAQVEAIKVYLFLKINCENKPLYQLFTEGRFNTFNLEEEELKKSTYEYLIGNPAAAAFYEYCVGTISASKENKSNLEKILKIIKAEPASIDYITIFKSIFYDISYSDYIFSLPMGAGKTFLMAAFMYLDLYFSEQDPENKAFAHNFIVLAPSGLKSSIVPSLKTISKFKPEWVLPDNIARKLRNEIVFETLESTSSAQKSNLVKNPNARKVSMYLKTGMRGVVFVTNAEKVILDRYRSDNQVQSDLYGSATDMLANELRHLIGNIPRLSIFIDEVHHASDDSVKLRQVVTEWAKKDTVVTVIGFSGTPYLQKMEKIPLIDKISFSSTEINNVVYYYPLVNGLGNFLKTPAVTQYENRENSLEILEDGLRDFFNNCKDTVYNDHTCAKIAVYCNSIDELENEIYASASKVLTEFGLNPAESILKYHENKGSYKLAPDAKMEFATLDMPQSKIRVILLVQIGKEGWDCRSLTGVILAKENKSVRNMVLQTCCRCLRQVTKYDKDEKAYIYVCKSNADLLEEQLKAEQHITLKEFQQAAPKPTVTFNFYNRKRIIDLPQIDYYQFTVEYNAIVEEKVDPCENIKAIPLEDLRISRQKITKSFENKIIDRSEENVEHGKENCDYASFATWIGEISKEGFNFVTRSQLYEHESELRQIFDTITYDVDSVLYFSSKFDRESINSMIRQAFYAKRYVNVTSEYLECSKDLLLVVNFVKQKEINDPEKYYPTQDAVQKIVEDDKTGFEGREIMRRRYHYMPYHMDSNFEIHILKMLHDMSLIKGSELEVYYNGDRFLSDFKIKCYESVGTRWKKLGEYTPDYLVIERKDGEIYKALILETKGEIYATDQTFQKKRNFVENYFLKNNNELYGYEKFDYLYIEDTMTENQQFDAIKKKIQNFFEVI